ncbi:DUF839 domain-containing protein [Rhizobium sp. 007]|nr:DUF839 domain-containing protein [Rhizobium sp. 007]
MRKLGALCADDVKILQNLQGVTVMEVTEGNNGWEIVLDSPFNRRITHVTPTKISGPAAGSDLIQTRSERHRPSRTFNNCGAGKTPWGTYLTCEENFNGYFGSTDPNFAMPDDFKRYGIAAETRYGYEAFEKNAAGRQLRTRSPSSWRLIVLLFVQRCPSSSSIGRRFLRLVQL